MLIIADATYSVGVPDGKTRYLNGVQGNYVLGRKGGSRKMRYGTDNALYTHIFRGGAIGFESSLNSEWTIKMETTSWTDDSGQGHALTNFPWNAINVTHNLGLPSYQGNVWLKAGSTDCIGFSGKITQKFNLCIQYTHTTSTEDKDKIVVATTRTDTSYNTSYDETYTADNNKTLYLQWFPYGLGEGRKDPVTSKTDEVPVYSGDWWQVRTSADD